MAKVPQRNVNLANRLTKLARVLLEDAERLTAVGEEPLSDPELAATQELLLGGFLSVREFRRKVNPIELKGQRL